MMPSNKGNLVQFLKMSHGHGLRRKYLPTPVAGEPTPLDVVEQHLGHDARSSTQQLLAVIDAVFDGLAVAVSGGGSSFILHKEYVAQWLLDLIELGDSPRQAVEKFFKFSKATKTKCKVIFYLRGIAIDHTIIISECITIEKSIPQRYYRITAAGEEWQTVNYGDGTVCLCMELNLNIHISKYSLDDSKEIRSQIESEQEKISHQKYSDVKKSYFI